MKFPEEETCFEMLCAKRTVTVDRRPDAVGFTSDSMSSNLPSTILKRTRQFLSVETAGFLGWN
ncbi:hypothetical protein EON65_36130 [archaeon]|nr:MAG: hypothetical protein EON65_36130 [archaeon]